MVMAKSPAKSGARKPFKTGGSKFSKAKGPKKSGYNPRFAKGLKDSVMSPYWRNIGLEINKNPTDIEDVFLKNVFEELEKEFKELWSSKSGSFLLQKLIKLANEAQMETILKCIVKDFYNIVLSQSGSFATETALFKITEYVNDDAENPFVKMLHQMGMMLLERTDLISDKASSHVIRALVQTMAGVRVAGESMTVTKEGKGKLTEHDMYSEFKDLIQAICAKVIPTKEASIGMVNEVTSAHTSFLAQTYLTILREKDPKACDEACKQIMAANLFHKTHSEGGVPEVMVSSGRFLQSLIHNMPANLLKKMFTEQILPHASRCLVDSKRSRILTELFAALSDTTMLVKLIEVLQDKPSLSLVYIAIAEMGVRLPEMQPHIINMFRKITDTESDELSDRLVPALLSEQPGSTLQHDDDVVKIASSGRLHKVWFSKSMAIQTMMAYSDDIVASSFTSMPYEIHLVLAKDKTGSFIYTAFADSSKVQQETKNAFSEGDAMMAIYGEIVLDMIGSRVFDSMWKCMTNQGKEAVMEVLKKNEKIMSSNRYGRIVKFNTKLADFINDNGAWQQWLAIDSKMSKLKLPAAAEKVEGKAMKRKAEPVKMEVDGDEEEAAEEEAAEEEAAEEEASEEEAAEEEAAEEEEMVSSPPVSKKKKTTTTPAAKNPTTPAAKTPKAKAAKTPKAKAAAKTPKTPQVQTDADDTTTPKKRRARARTPRSTIKKAQA